MYADTEPGVSGGDSRCLCGKLRFVVLVGTFDHNQHIRPYVNESEDD